MAQVAKGKHAINEGHGVRRGLKLFGHKGANVFLHAGLDLEPDHAASATPLQRRLEQAHQVFGLLLDLEIAVADDAEHALALDRIARKQPARVKHDHLFERDEALGPRLGEIGQANEALDVAGKADQAVQDPLCLRAHEPQGDRQAQVRDERERMSRIDRERRQHGKDVLEEVILEPAHLSLREIRGVNQDDAFKKKIISQRAPAGLLIGRKLRDLGCNLRQLLLRR